MWKLMLSKPLQLRVTALLFCGVSAASLPVLAQSESSSSTQTKPSTQELVKLKQNPVSGLRQFGLDASYSPDVPDTDESLGDYSLQLVWPLPVNEDWRMVTYTILPFIELPDIDGEGSTFGLGDTSLNFFLTSAKPGSVVWGLGPAVTLPTRTDSVLGSDRVGAGPSGILFYAASNWSAGVVAQNIWSIGGSGDDRVNEFSAQYILNYNLPKGWFLYSNATILSNWRQNSGDRWTVPIGGGLGRVFDIGKQSVSLSAQAFSNVEVPEGGPDWYLNVQFALLFP